MKSYLPIYSIETWVFEMAFFKPVNETSFNFVYISIYNELILELMTS